MRTEKLTLWGTIGLLSVIFIVTFSMLVTAFTHETEERFSTPKSLQVSAERAEAIAQGVVTGVLEETELSRINNKMVYTVEIVAEDVEYDVLVDARTGSVIATYKETRNDADAQPLISESYARTVANNRVKGTIAEVDLETINGKLVYEVEIKHSNKEFEVQVDAMTGDVLNIKEEVKEQPKTGSITQQEAIQIAQQQQSGRFIEVEMERERGKQVWAVEILQGGYEYEVLVDISTGRVIGVHKELED